MRLKLVVIAEALEALVTLLSSMACAVTIQQVWSISTHDGKKTWHVPANQCLEVNGKTFVKLPRSNCQFAPLVFHGCTDLPCPKKELSLTASVGYDELLKLRNTMQASELQTDAVNAAPEIFKALLKGSGKQQKQKDKKRSQQELKELRLCPDTVSITINDWSFDVLKPVCATDELAVEMDPDTISKIIKYLQQKGFSSVLQHSHKKRHNMPDDTPKGIHDRGQQGYVVTLPSGQDQKYKRVKTYEEALQRLHGIEVSDAEDVSPPQHGGEAGDEPDSMQAELSDKEGADVVEESD